MRCPAKIWLPVMASGAMALSACSGSSATEIENNIHSPGNSVDALGNDVDNRSAEDVEEGPPIPLDHDDFTIPSDLCLDAARQRYGIATNVITNSAISVGGNTRQTLQGEVTLDLPGPPARRFICRLARGAVVSVIEVDAPGPVAIRD